MELHAFAGAKTRDLKSFGLRFFNIYGPRQDPHSPYSGVIAVFMRNALDGRPIMVHGNGEQVRDFVFVTDAVQALRRAMKRIQDRRKRGGGGLQCLHRTRHLDPHVGRYRREPVAARSENRHEPRPRR